jgi:tubulin--tyrosine ligase
VLDQYKQILIPFAICFGPLCSLARFTLTFASSPLRKSEKSDPVSLPQSMQDLSLAAPAAGIKHFNALIDYGDTYVQPLILAALSKLLPKDSYTLITPDSIPTNSTSPTLHIQQYEELPFDTLLSQPTTTLANAYIIRKALIRKHYLSATAHAWGTKNPSTALAKHVTPTVHFEVDYAEFLDDALVECFELHEMFARNADKEESEREWWILKPGMSDRGQGIRLFDSEETLQAIFDEWEAERPDSDDEEEDDEDANMNDGKDYIMTSQLRHFVTQPYIHPTLLLQDNPHKFHIRTYVLAVGALTVYVYRPMLALFAGTPYTAPAAQPDLRAHLTNTCLQDGSRDGSVAAFWELGASQPGLPSSWQEDVFAQICEVTGELFEGAARTMGTHFQALPNAFEVFGVDFVVDREGGVWLLEVNAFPDFGQTGEAHADVVEGLWEGVVDVAVKPFFGGGTRGEGGMVEVRKIDLGRR